MWAGEGVEEGGGRVGRCRAGKVSGSKGAEVEGERIILLLVTMNMRTKEGEKDGKKEKGESREKREKVVRKGRKS